MLIIIIIIIIVILLSSYYLPHRRGPALRYLRYYVTTAAVYAAYKFLVGMRHIDDDDALFMRPRVCQSARAILCHVYRRLVTSADSKAREESTPIHGADMASMTAALPPPFLTAEEACNTDQDYEHRVK